MALFRKVDVCCNVCGRVFQTSFMPWDGRVCSDDCSQALQLKRAASCLGEKDPYPAPLLEIE
jgi:hypothetical protein